jgi:predicted CXXCH cytochrome family protein
MRSFPIRAWTAVAAASLLGVAFLTAAGTAVWAGIATTKHNLSTTGIGDNHVTVGTNEICVFCHTPHGADTSATVPLWNKKLPPGTGYQTYASLGSSTLDAQTTTNVGSVSLACLSCHDGTQAMDNILNAPGSGGFDPTGGGPTGLPYTWTGSQVTPQGFLTNQAGGINIALITRDLRGHHPIGIQYCGGGVTATSPNGPCKDADFVEPSNAVISGEPVWWVDTGAAGLRQKTDMILYTRLPSDGYPGQTQPEPFVECGSCHDPHTDAQPTFLRTTNDGSRVCLSCHIK